MKFLQTSIVFFGLLATAFALSATFGSILASTQHATASPTHGVYYVKTVNFTGYFGKIVDLIDVIDNFANNSGAEPRIVSGGPGYTYATVKLYGQPHEGVNSTVKFWVQN